MSTLIPRDPATEGKPVLFPEWKPDAPDFGGDGLPLLRNALPKTTGFYGPVRALVSEDANAMSDLQTVERVHGFFGETAGHYAVATADSGIPGGSTTGLYIFKRDITTGAWSDVTPAGPPGMLDYDLARFCTFTYTSGTGGDRILAVGWFYPLMRATSGSFALISGAPFAYDVATVRDFLVAIQVTDNSAVFFRDGIWWSGIGDPTSWPTVGGATAISVQSDRVRLRGGGALMRILPGIGGNDAVILGEHRIWRMNYAGGVAGRVFQFDVAVYNQGVFAPGSVVADGANRCFFLGNDGFYMFDGFNLQPISDGKVTSFFLGDYVPSDSARHGVIKAGHDPKTKTVWWTYPNADADPDYLPNRQLVYNYLTGRWGLCELEGWIFDTTSRQIEVPAHDAPTEWESTFIAIGPDLELSRLTGDTLEAEIEDVEHAAPDFAKTRVQRVRPLIDAAPDDLSVQVSVRNDLGQAVVDHGPNGLEQDGQAAFNPCPTGRFFRARTTIAAAATWNDAVGVVYETSPAGVGPARRS